MAVCARCQRGVPQDARFCPACGTRLGAVEVLGRAPRRVQTPSYLAERILASGETLAGERKQVTVLFADLKGSMEILADRDPEEAGDILDAVIERMIEAVHRYDGTVSQVMGDGIMALFGAPLAHEDHAVHPLPPPEAERLLDGLVGTDPALGPVKRLLVERTEGNPLFLEECVRSLVETGGLVGGPGASRLGRPVSAIDVPSTVRAVLEARIDRLPSVDKRLLQAAAVVGEEVPATLVEAIADLPPDTVRAGLGGLRASGLLREVALFPDIEYAFSHALAHDVAYEGLLHDQRRALPSVVPSTRMRRGPASRRPFLSPRSSA